MWSNGLCLLDEILLLKINYEPVSAGQILRQLFELRACGRDAERTLQLLKLFRWQLAQAKPIGWRAAAAAYDAGCIDRVVLEMFAESFSPGDCHVDDMPVILHVLFEV